MNMVENNQEMFPEGRTPLENRTFRFACHEELDCFMSCCRRLDMFLYPYDVIRLKQHLGIDSEAFMHRYTRLGEGSHPYFPAVLMRMVEEQDAECPFLGRTGCVVYADRPTACRSYPIERAVDRTPVRGRPEEYYFLARHSYCHGHGRGREWKVSEWLRDQHLLDYNLMNDLWAEVDTLFASNPWQGEGTAGPRQQLAFLVCYNIDGFRRLAGENKLLQRFRLDKARRRAIERDDAELLKFGFDWLRHTLGGQAALRPR